MSLLRTFCHESIAPLAAVVNALCLLVICLDPGALRTSVVLAQLGLGILQAAFFLDWLRGRS